jgi:hypothetical protein
MSEWTDVVPSRTHHVKRTEIPLVCTLEPDDGSTRLARWRALHELADPVARFEDGELEVRYRAAPGVLEELESLASAERICCSFVTWAVRDDDGQAILQVIAPVDSPDAVAPIAVMFGVTDSSKDSSHGVGS